MAHVQTTDISLAFGDRDILKNVTLSLSSGDRCALAGANGSGKSTLMKIIAGLSEPDSGTVVRSSDAGVVYLPQSGITHSGRTLIEETELAFENTQLLIEEQEEVAERLAGLKPGDPKLAEVVEEHHVLQERILHSGYYDREAEIDRVLTGLGFTRPQFDHPTDTFSGGWQMRIALAKVLLQHPDFLLLDEPTNYLDLEARIWLGSYLSAFPGGVLMVSHDRRFLDQTVSYVWELYLGDVKRYRGSYTAYEHQRESEIQQTIAAYEQQQEEIRRMEDFIRRFRATASKARQVQSRIKQLEKMEQIRLPEHLKHMSISFPPAPRSGNEVVRLLDVSRAYDENLVLHGVDLTVTRGERVVLVGPNGAGKSTLMRIIAGRDSDYHGELDFGADVAGGFYADDDNWLSRHTSEDSGGPTVLEALQSVARNQNDQQVRDLLGSFLFRGDDIYKHVSVLSGGERSRLAMLKLLLQPLNLLVLDEPTNHLDLASKDILLDALKQFGGTLVFVSHDREFVEQLATRVVEIRPGGVSPQTPSLVSDFPGDYSYYAWRVEQREEEQAAESAMEATAATHDHGGASPEHVQGRQAPLSRDEQKARRSRIQKLERLLHDRLEQIGELESRAATIKEELALPEVYGDGQQVKNRTEELSSIESSISSLTSEWEEAVAEHEELIASSE